MSTTTAPTEMIPRGDRVDESVDLVRDPEKTLKSTAIEIRVQTTCLGSCDDVERNPI